MIPHTVVVVIEPPGTSMLDLSNRRIILKTANDRIENGIVIGIQGIENRLWKLLWLLLRLTP